MGKYSAEHVLDESKACKARGNSLRVHFKNTRETAMAIQGMSLFRAQAYLQNVLAHKEAIPFRRFKGGVGRKAQAKNLIGGTQCRWPKKSVEHVLSLLQNAGSNAQAKGLSLEKLHVCHVQVQQAPKQRRRTYRAHGRIGPYMCSPSHIEMILEEQETAVPRGRRTPAVSKPAASSASSSVAQD